MSSCGEPRDPQDLVFAARRTSSQQFFDHRTPHVGQAELVPLERKREPQMVQAQQMQNRGSN